MGKIITANMSPRTGFYYRIELRFSKAYIELTKAARDLLYCFIIGRRWKGKGKNKIINNNGEIIFSERQFKEELGYCSATYNKARNQLIKNGFIIQKYEGGMSRGDCAKYKLLCIEGVPRHEQRWLKYSDESWESDIPRRINNSVGKKTRWKKGESGRILKSTLKI